MSVAVVTGAARGIGAATARLLARDGWQLVLLDKCADDPGLAYPLARPEDLEAVVAACGGSGRAAGVTGDVRDRTSLEAAVAMAEGRFGGLDAAVAVAGAIGGSPGIDVGDELWDTMFGVNLLGVRRLAEAAIPAMLRRPRPREGRFVAVASAAALVGLPRLAAYSAAKHAVVGYIRSLAAELGEEGITANVVTPGSTRTHALHASAGVYGLSDVEAFARHHLSGRLLEPEEVGEAIAFLLRPASSGMTGAVVPVDGGFTAR